MAGFNSDLHPRGPNGRFTKSWTKALSAADRKKAKRTRAAFKAADFDTTSLSAWKGTLTGDELGAVDRFTAGDWKSINADLRAGHADGPDIPHLDSAAHPLPHDVELHRQVPLHILGGVDPEKLVGRKVKDAGYAPTTVTPTAVTDPATVRMHISAPAGTLAFGTGEPGEVVLARDTELAIESVTPDGNGGYDMQLVVLPKPRRKAPEPAPAEAVKGKPAAKTLLDTSGAAAGAGLGARSIAEVDLARAGQDVYGGTFGGLTATVTTTYINSDGSILFIGVIGSGEYKGKFERLLGSDESGDLFVSHEYLTLAPDVQGQRFAEEFNANAEQWYRESGISRIKLHANINVGGYAWARAGFDFATEAQRSQKIVELESRIRQYEWKAHEAKTDVERIGLESQAQAARALVDRAKSGERISAYEISQVGRPADATGKDAEWIGKVLLIGSDWQAVKWL